MEHSKNIYNFTFVETFRFMGRHPHIDSMPSLHRLSTDTDIVNVQLACKYLKNCKKKLKFLKDPQTHMNIIIW